MFWTSSSGEVELNMTYEQAQSVSHQGRCDEDVAELAKVPAIAKQLDKMTDDNLRSALKGFGAWDEAELSDRQANLHRIVWLAGGDIADSHRVNAEGLFASGSEREPGDPLTVDCVHDEGEDCLNCQKCGKCRETVDENDICGDCR